MRLTKLRKTRRAHELSQTNLGLATGIPQSRISYLERKGRARLDEIVTLARFFGVSENELLGRRRSPEVPRG